MPIVTYNSFNYHLEKSYYKEFNPLYVRMLSDKPELQIDFHVNEEKFLHLLSNAIRVDRHYLVLNLLRQINRHLKTDLEIKIFLFQSEKFESYCTPRITQLGGNEENELIVLVSQHFFNNLGEYERIPIIAHELAHGIFKHANYPLKTILSKDLNLAYEKELKIAMVKWSFCAEITADAFSLIASDFNPQIVCRSLIKHTSGLQDVHGDDLIKMAIEQYEELASTVHHKDIATHPLMPMRIKIIEEISKCNLAKSFGKELDVDTYDTYVEEYNTLINNLVVRIYPEVIDVDKAIDFELQFLMSIAVTLSDYVLDAVEIEQLKLLVSDHPEYSEKLKYILSQTSQFHTEEAFKLFIRDIIDRSILRAKEIGYNKHDLVALVRYLIFCAACDGDVHINELNTIFKFARKFGFKRSDLILILSTQNYN